MSPPLQAASGSQWNLNSWHFEEQKYDEWGKKRLKEVLHADDKIEHDIQYQGLELPFSFRFTIHKMDGECVRMGLTLTLNSKPFKYNPGR